MSFLLSTIKIRQDISIFQGKLNLLWLHNLGRMENRNNECFLVLKTKKILFSIFTVSK